MIFLARIHLKLSAHRKYSLFLDYATENGIKRGLQDLTEWLSSHPPLVPISEIQWNDLRQAPFENFPGFLQDTLGAVFPREVDEAIGGLRWKSESACTLESFDNRGDFGCLLVRIHIDSTGMMTRLSPQRTSTLEGSLGILAGHLPLPSLPFLIDKDMDESDLESFLESNDISLLEKPGITPSPRAAAAEAVIPKDAGPLLAEALKIRVFYPQGLSNGALRKALGLESLDEPVPDGVYLVHDDLGLGGVFVQGDLDTMILAIEENSQLIVFRMAESEWTLKFCPEESRTEFLTPQGRFSCDLLPLGIIIVNGEIASLGGGAVGLDGKIEVVTDREIPSVLSGVNLSIVASEKITLTSHLILQGVSWQEGIPYIKDSRAELVLFSTGQDVISGTERDGGIAVAVGAPRRLKVQASLTAGGAGFEIQGQGKTIEILGGLQTTEFESSGNSLRIVPDERIGADNFPGHSPLSAIPHLTVSSLEILNWKEY